MTNYRDMEGNTMTRNSRPTVSTIIDDRHTRPTASYPMIKAAKPALETVSDNAKGATVGKVIKAHDLITALLEATK